MAADNHDVRPLTGSRENDHPFKTRVQTKQTLFK